MSKYLAVAFAVARVVAGQYYTISGTVYTSTITTITDSSSTSADSVPSFTSMSSSIDTGVSSDINTSVLTGSPVSSSSTVTLPSGVAEIVTALSCVASSTLSVVSPFVTVYNTVYVDVCPTGTIQVTYTITDTCGCQYASDYTRPTGIPSGFTVTSKICSACPGMPTITVTQPIVGVAPTTASSPHANSTSGPAPKVTYQPASGAVPTTGISVLGSFMVMMITLVAGLMCVL